MNIMAGFTKLITSENMKAVYRNHQGVLPLVTHGAVVHHLTAILIWGSAYADN